MTKIIQPQIHTRVTIRFRSGFIDQFVVGYEIRDLKNWLNDVNGHIHGLNPTLVESFLLEPFNAESGIT